MDFNIRQEQIKDYEAVHKVVELAFRDMEDLSLIHISEPTRH